MKKFKKITAIILVFAMLFAFASCGEEKEKTPSAAAGTEKQQEYTKKGLELVKATYGEIGYEIEFAKQCYFKENSTPENYGLPEKDPSYKNIVARMMYVWVIQQTIPMYTVVFIDADGNADYYTYMYDETAQAYAEKVASEVATFDVMYEKAYEIQYNECLTMNEVYIPQSDEELSGWTVLDISHLL